MISKSVIKLREHLSGDRLFNLIYSDFHLFTDYRQEAKVEIPLPDALMSAFSVFSLKYPSLLQFQKDSRDEIISKNLRNVYRLKCVPSDTQMREIIDPIDPSAYRPVFKNIFTELQRGKVLEGYRFLDRSYLLAMDGTGYFSSGKVHCENCLVKTHKNGEVTYAHNMLAAAIVCPGKKEVIPFAPEPIIRQDGKNKNDCERNASHRLLAKIKKDHPRLPLIIMEDGLASNAPHLKDIQKYGFGYITGVKSGDHKFLFDLVAEKKHAGESTQYETTMDGVTHRFNFINNVPLNASHQNYMVNFIEYREIKGDKTQYFSWVTSLSITKENVYKIMQAGRARWKIENETFNTLKNQGYQFEHNFGHGFQNLSVNLAMAMMLAFLVDQVQQICCKLFQLVLKKVERKMYLWEKIRIFFFTFVVESWEMLLRGLYFGVKTDFKILDGGS